MPQMRSNRDLPTRHSGPHLHSPTRAGPPRSRRSSSPATEPAHRSPTLLPPRSRLVGHPSTSSSRHPSPQQFPQFRRWLAPTSAGLHRSHLVTAECPPVHPSGTRHLPLDRADLAASRRRCLRPSHLARSGRFAEPKLRSSSIRAPPHRLHFVQCPAQPQTSRAPLNGSRQP